MSEPTKFVKDRKPARHFAVPFLFIDGFFAVCGQSLPEADAKIGQRLTKRWRMVTCKRCLGSRWGGSVTR